AGAALAVIFGVAADANAQTAGPTNIPLQLHNNNGAERLVINVGIAGGAAKPYLFDTGSALFNAAYNPVWWGNVPASSSLQTNVEYCYIGNSGCRGYVGNIVQVPTLSFYETSTSTTAAATLNANPGYQVNAVYLHTDPTVTPPVSQNFPGYFDTPGAPAPVEGYFYGTFGAANFAPEARIHNQPGPSGFYVGSVLGQTSVSGVAAQGYVVAANGQKNPTSDINGPQQVNGDKVKVGGHALQKITQCNPCVTLGLTSQMLGQFMPVGPTGTAGVVPWTSPTTTHSFPNPYGGATGNNSSTEFGANYTVTLTGATTPASAAGLLDTGTANVMLSQDMSAGNTTGGTLTVTGAGAGGAMVPGLTTTSMVLNSDSSSAYHATTTTVQTNTIGLPFFLQNSVLYDLSNRVIGYTPFFVTDATVTTTSDGPLIVDATNVPLGLAGAISGAGGLTIERGGAVQLSATNNYSGPTAIAAASGGVDAGLLYISGPGSIAASSGVANDGLLDISRAWSGVQVTSLTGSGQVNLGGRILTLTNASGTFSGVIADGGAYPGSGGGLALTGGAMVLSGVNTYTGGTSVSGGATLGVVANNGLGHAGGGVTLDGGALTALASFSSARLVTLGAGGGTIDTQANTLTLTTALSGAGGLTKEGAGILILSGANSHAGGTMINAGTLRLAAGASLPTVGALIVNGGTFDLNGNDLTVSSLSGTGGTIALGSGNLIANDAGNNSLSAVITGTGGLTMSGTGTLNLTGVNTYTGPTTVSNGRLAVNGSITSNVTVGPGGILGGVGTIFGTVTGGGTTAPGNSIGTLNVVGSFTQNPGSTYQVETNATGQSDLINVTGAPGTATIAGGTVQALPEAGVYAPSTTYTILSATGGVTGTYNGVTSNLPFLQASLGYDTNNVYLTLKPGGFAAGAQTANQAAVGGVLDQSVA
ncbi:MAG: autotransporter-associated beta strand repeat-containing protein, partial [Reyranella sp.]|nr:autotransporter-associated beta strand repeat-containing protein [Reyranella sp.]